MAKSWTHNQGVLSLSHIGSSYVFLFFFVEVSLGKIPQSPSLVLVKPRKDMNIVSCLCYMTEMPLKAASIKTLFNLSLNILSHCYMSVPSIFLDFILQLLPTLLFLSQAPDSLQSKQSYGQNNLTFVVYLCRCTCRWSVLLLDGMIYKQVTIKLNCKCLSPVCRPPLFNIEKQVFSIFNSLPHNSVFK